jgi:exodeoxyribonuclease-5
MIDDPLYDIIMTEANENNVKIIAMGDSYQLPPVEQDHDSIFFRDIDATLTEPMRFQGPIENLAAIFRKEIRNINEDGDFDKWAVNSNTKRQDSHDTILDSGYSFTNKVQEVVEMAANGFKLNKDDNNHSRILAYKNDSVDRLNTSIRYLIYGANTKQFEEDEIVISNSNYRPFGGAAPLIHNGRVLRVHSFIEDEGPHEIPCLKVKFKDFNSELYPPIYVVSKANGGAGVKKYEAKLQQLKYAASKNSEALQAYREFVDQFAYFDYAYAVNLYRAQGSTFENAYVFEGEVMNVKPLTWKQKFQALYVAVTRPRKNLVIYNKDF